MNDPSDDESPYSISDDEDDTHERLEIKPPQAKISKRSHSRRSDKHSSSNRQVYVSSRHRHKSHHSRHPEKRYVNDRSESSRLPYAKEYEDRLKEHDDYRRKKAHYHRREEKPKDERYKMLYTEMENVSYEMIERSKEPDLREIVERRRRHHKVYVHKEKNNKEKMFTIKERSRHERHEVEKERRPEFKKHHREEKKRSRSRTPKRHRHSSNHEKSSASKSDQEFSSPTTNRNTVIDVETSPPVLRDYSETQDVKELEEGEVEEQNSGIASGESSVASSREGSTNSNSSSGSGTSSSSGESSSESSSENGEDEESQIIAVDDDVVEKPEEVIKLAIDQTEEKENSMAKANRVLEDSNVEAAADSDIELEKDTLPMYYPAIQGCRSVEEFQCLNRIAEGTYGVVYRALEKRTEKIVALKRLKMEKEKDGFPITSLREINTLLKAQHQNIVTVREIVVGSNMDKIYIVMDYVEHDLKSLMETMKQSKAEFKASEVKCLTVQLLRAVSHLHDNWILHRDLKTSNLLFSHTGMLKVGDFGLAREYGSPLKHYTPVVVTLWYRAPELLLGSKEYTTSIDMWSVGCILAEILRMDPLFPGRDEMDQLKRVFKVLGTPTEKTWPEYPRFPLVQNASIPVYPCVGIRTKFKPNTLTDVGFDFISELLTYNTKKRITAEAALQHPYFREHPLPIDPKLFRQWTAKSESNNRKTTSPKPPSGGQNYKDLKEDDGFYIGGEGNALCKIKLWFSKQRAAFLYGFTLNAPLFFIVIHIRP